MRKLLIILSIVTLLPVGIFASGIKFSVLTFYTSDLQSGNYNVWPILYFRVPLINTFGLNLEDYVMSTHKTFNIGNVRIMEPTYWYASYRNGSWRAYLGHFKSKHTLTRQMYLLRVGGFYDTTTGAEVDFRNYTYDLGLRYDWKYSEIAAYAGISGNNYKAYLYANKQGNDTLSLSTNITLSMEKGNFDAFLWGAAAYNLDLSNISFGMPTILVGERTHFGVWTFSAQYARRPDSHAAKIWYDFNDPNKAGYPLQDFNSKLTYKIDRLNSLSLLANWNSNLTIPMFGVEISHGDLSLSLGTSDLDGGINGTQYVTLSYSNYFSIPITTHPLFFSSAR
jgi:hypothetical protein